MEPIDTFDLCFTDEILDEVFLRRNEREIYKTKNATVSDTTFPELKVLNDLLFLAASLKNNLFPADLLFGGRYKAIDIN